MLFTEIIIKLLFPAMIMEINTGKTSSAHKYDEMEGQLKEYMRHKQLPSYMRHRILRYYEFKYQKKYFRENEILNNISEQLRQVKFIFGQNIFETNQLIG